MTATRSIARTADVPFRTSGSTGPAACWWRTPQQLRSEVDLVAAVCDFEVDLIVSFAPPGHLYGCLFGKVLPAASGLAVVEAWRQPERLPRLPAAARVLFVCVPSSWPLLRRHSSLLAGARALHSSGPLTAAAYETTATLQHSSFELTELFGSTETGAVGYRRIPGHRPSATRYKLFPDVALIPGPSVLGGELLTVASTRIGRRDDMAARPRTWQLDDVVRRASGGCFDYLGRASRLIKINGRRTDLDWVEARLRANRLGLEVACLPVADAVRGEHFDLYYRVAHGSDPLEGCSPGEQWRRLAGDPRGLIAPRMIRRVSQLPRTPTGKLDVPTLAALTATEETADDD
jgi:acyl-coenzyme A synthetase/AMP-(fatty) acid ligase